MSNETQRLLVGVARRESLRSIGVWTFRLLFVLAAVYLTLLAVSRLLALLPDWFEPVTVLAVPLGALAVALIVARRSDLRRAARLVDEKLKSKDLFLTSTLLAEAPGAYRPVVEHQAQEKSQAVKPSQVVPFAWWNPTWRGSLCVGALVVAAMFTPQFDPFGRFEEMQRQAERQKQLESQKQVAVQRIEALKAKPLDEPVSDQVQAALDDLKQTFDQARPDQPKTNLARLNDEQKQVGKQWRQAMEQNLKRASSDLAQQFGNSNQQTQQWRKQMQEGDASGVKQAVREAQEMAKKLAATKDPLEQQKLKSGLQEKLQQLSDFANSNARGSQLDAAMQQAMQQLQLSSMEGLEGEALDALDATLEMSELEAEQLAQQLRDLKALEKALQAIQMAKQLNGGQGSGGGLNGEGTGQCKSMAEYIEHYKKMMGEGVCSNCNGAGCSACGGTGKGSGSGGGGGQGGIGGQGQGRGGLAPEDDSAVTDFTPEKDRSQVSAGKMLLQWKTHETAEAGEAKLDYNQAVQQVKQGVSEAILQEQVPPGYHEAIQQYFDTLKPRPQ